MNYPDSVRFLYTLGNEQKTAKLGLERIARLMKALGHPERRPARFVHVAGTNGKGSTCAFIESGLRQAGLRTGLFTSPHLLEPVERIRVSGVPVTTERFAAAFARVHDAAEKLILAGAIDSHPSYFETATAMAFELFRDERVDVAVMEVGLGGRLDATNVVEPELCVITPVDFDHEAYLGSSLDAIAGEKAGIIKPGIPVVLAPQRLEADIVIRERARALAAPVIDAGQPDEVDAHRTGSRVKARGVELSVPLRGRHQAVNAATAAAALAAMGIAPKSIVCGIIKTRWPGRLERVRERPDVILDGAHNPAGARTLASYVAEFYNHPKPILVFGAMRDKAVDEICEVLFPCFQHVILTAPDQPRALAPEALRELAENVETSIAPDVGTALAQARRMGPAVFVSGSLFLVSEAMRALGIQTISPRTRSS